MRPSAIVDQRALWLGQPKLTARLRFICPAGMEASVDLYEYQARDIFEAYEVPVLRGLTATTPAEAKEAAAKIGTPVVVVKAQV